MGRTNKVSLKDEAKNVKELLRTIGIEILQKDIKTIYKEDKSGLRNDSLKSYCYTVIMKNQEAYDFYINQEDESKENYKISLCSFSNRYRTERTLLFSR